jgi:hypothetical protein
MNYAIVAVVAFGLGKVYGARVQKEAVTVALAAFVRAKAFLAGVIAKAQAEAKAEVARLEAVAQKYL